MRRVQRKRCGYGHHRGNMGDYLGKVKGRLSNYPGLDPLDTRPLHYTAIISKQDEIALRASSYCNGAYR